MPVRGEAVRTLTSYENPVIDSPAPDSPIPDPPAPIEPTVFQLEQSVERIQALADAISVHSEEAPGPEEATELEETDAPPEAEVVISDLLILRIDEKLAEIVRKAGELERERIDIERMQKQLQHAIDTAEAKLAQSPALHREVEFESMDQLIQSLKLENARLNNLLANARTEYQALLDFIEKDDIAELTNSIRNDAMERERELRLEVDRLQEQVALLQNEVGPSIGSDYESELQEQLAEVRSQLIEARHESVELRLQCNDLSTRLAQFQSPKSLSTEAWSWEERKQAWLRQLEEESNEGTADAKKTLEIQEILERTTHEVERRDREIADLKSLLEQQAVASNGMAVGAAAVAQIIEADELIVEERQRLKQLQEEWEQKQRQGEIEMSLERAKLARERLELQEKLRSLEAMQPMQSTPENGEESIPNRRPRGNWLSRLGLRDE
ncbi:hypothetical protein VN12_20495 [Pirellula sp. SH-Sr6A]|nr:hypothetical protein VN12_20495 [Pirellula sp. SH-Sr6A]